MPEELRTEVGVIVQETVVKTIPKKRKCKQAKRLSEEALKIAEKRSERQRRRGKIYPYECRVVKNSKERESFSVSSNSFPLEAGNVPCMI